MKLLELEHYLAVGRHYMFCIGLVIWLHDHAETLIVTFSHGSLDVSGRGDATWSSPSLRSIKNLVGMQFWCIFVLVIAASGSVAGAD